MLIARLSWCRLLHHHTVGLGLTMSIQNTSLADIPLAHILLAGKAT
jgi:hypothetical protein